MKKVHSIHVNENHHNLKGLQREVMDTSNIKCYQVMLNDIEQWNTSGE